MLPGLHIAQSPHVGIPAQLSGSPLSTPLRAGSRGWTRDHSGPWDRHAVSTVPPGCRSPLAAGWCLQVASDAVPLGCGVGSVACNAWACVQGSMLHKSFQAALFLDARRMSVVLGVERVRAAHSDSEKAPKPLYHTFASTTSDRMFVFFSRFSTGGQDSCPCSEQSDNGPGRALGTSTAGSPTQFPQTLPFVMFSNNCLGTAQGPWKGAHRVCRTPGICTGTRPPK